MKIAIAQTEIMFEQPEENLANAAAWIAQAAAAQADCIVFPEMSFTGFSMQVEKIAGSNRSIPEGQRNSTLSRIAGRRCLRSCGYPS